MKTLDDFMFEYMKERELWVTNTIDTPGWKTISERYAQYMCEQQRLLCCEQITLGNTVLKLKEQILSTPLATLKTH